MSAAAEGSASTTSAAAARAVWFTGQRQAEIVNATLPPLADRDVKVRSLVSLISAGTELSVYRGDVSGDLGLVPLDDGSMVPLEGDYGFPIKYGYQVVGEVVEAGPRALVGVGDLVFAMHPHQTVFSMSSHPLLMTRLPAGLAPERAAFVHLLSVALTSQLDVPVRHGDCVVVFGLGVVGSFIAELVRRTAGRVIVVDLAESRRQDALALGADAAVAPEELAAVVAELTEGRGADIAYEASGAPAAVQAAIEVTGQEGSIVEVSYFGDRVVPLVLSPDFHFRRQSIVSSQCNPFRTDFPPRWSWPRVQRTALNLLSTDWLATPSARHVPFEDAAEAYRLLDSGPGDTAGILLDYDTLAPS